MYFFLFNRTTLQVFVTHLTGALYVLLNKKKYIYSYPRCIVYDRLLKPRQSFRITLYKTANRMDLFRKRTLHLLPKWRKVDRTVTC